MFRTSERAAAWPRALSVLSSIWLSVYLFICISVYLSLNKRGLLRLTKRAPGSY